MKGEKKTGKGKQRQYLGTRCFYILMPSEYSEISTPAVTIPFIYLFPFSSLRRISCAGHQDDNEISSENQANISPQHEKARLDFSPSKSLLLVINLEKQNKNIVMWFYAFTSISIILKRSVLGIFNIKIWHYRKIQFCWFDFKAIVRYVF